MGLLDKLGIGGHSIGSFVKKQGDNPLETKPKIDTGVADNSNREVGWAPLTKAAPGKISYDSHPPANAPPTPYWGGTKAAQDEKLKKLTPQLLTLQDQLAVANANGDASKIEKARTFHDVGQAVSVQYTPYDNPDFKKLGIDPVGIFDPKTALASVTARMSYGRGDNNTNSLQPDVRGMAVRFETADGQKQDLTTTNAQVPFFRNPAELTAFGYATKDLVKDHGTTPLEDPAKGTAALLKYVPNLAKELRTLEPDVYPAGPAGEAKALERAAQMLKDATGATLPRPSLAGATFWSGAPIKFGDKLVKFAFVPQQNPSGLPSKDLLGEMGNRPNTKYDLCIQFYTDEKNTPTSPNGAWSSPLLKMGELNLNTGSLNPKSPDHAAQQELQKKFDKEGFNPGNALKGNEPFGLNEQRVSLYKADHQARCPMGFG